MRFLLATVTLLSSLSIAHADEPVIVPPVAGYMNRIIIDAQTPNKVTFTWRSDDISGMKIQESTLNRARVLSRKLRDLFGTRVWLSDFDTSNRKDIAELGLSIESGLADDVAKLTEFKAFLAKNEELVRIRSGILYAVAGKADDACLDRLAKVFPDIRYVELIGCPVTGDAWRTLAKWKQLKELTITGANLSGKSAAPLAGLTELTRLDLRGSGNDEHAKWIGELTQLQNLDLQDSPLTDVGLAQLAGLTKLESLTLANTAISDAGLASLKGMTKLKLLSLQGTKLTGSSLYFLKEMPLEEGGLAMQRTLLTGKNWMEHVPNFKSYNKGLMMFTRDSKITPEEEARIRKMLPPSSGALLQ